MVALRVTDPDSRYTLNLTKGKAGDVDATLTIADSDLVALSTGKTTAQAMFQSGKLRIDGDVKVAQRLGLIIGRKA